MRVELSNLDQRTFNRARAQLDEAGIEYEAIVLEAVGKRRLLYKSDDARSCRNFVHVALHDPAEKVYR